MAIEQYYTDKALSRKKAKSVVKITTKKKEVSKKREK
jgi:hypothetical protein